MKTTTIRLLALLAISMSCVAYAAQPTDDSSLRQEQTEAKNVEAELAKAVTENREQAAQLLIEAITAHPEMAYALTQVCVRLVPALEVPALLAQLVRAFPLQEAVLRSAVSSVFTGTGGGAGSVLVIPVDAPIVSPSNSL